ncbi:MAG TPA: polysaccharide deacetylase family protein [Polyangiaceae bacterium]|jgi:peptidoglycan/xylan/chitin deacetylase (PgdA/CDA1 family)|nr:polysaccharide deacetylase family protein [Polyangiaceae bacterium]
MALGLGDIGAGLRRSPRVQQLGHVARANIRKLAESVMPTSMVVWRGRTSGAGDVQAGKVALTFDDGPDAMTPEYLAILSELGVRATFFVIGAQCEKKPDMVSRIADAGHELGAHGFTHRRFPSLRPRELETELRDTQKLLPKSVTPKPLVRPPHGSVSVSSMLTCTRAGFTTVLWSRDSNDCRTEATADVVRSFDEQHVRQGEIVLMHEGQRWTVDSLPEVVGRIREAGHALVTVGELLDG